MKLRTLTTIGLLGILATVALWLWVDANFGRSKKNPHSSTARSILNLYKSLEVLQNKGQDNIREEVLRHVAKGRDCNQALVEVFKQAGLNTGAPVDTSQKRFVDGWGQPLVVQWAVREEEAKPMQTERTHLFSIRSAGANGSDECGRGDDIKP